MSDRKAIEEYWEDPNTISLLDTNLRRLEEQAVLRYLHPQMKFADLGCGGAESTVVYAAKVKSCLALEQSNTLLAKAKQRLAAAKAENVTLVKGSVTDLSAFPGEFHAVVTQRVVINFTTWDEQRAVIENIRSTIRPGGLYIMIENTFEGFEEMNSVRRAAGLANVPLHDWHNYFLHHDRFMDFIGKYFIVEAVHNFNLYYLLTRVFTNMFASFEGFGATAKKDDIFTVADEAARRLHDIMNGRLHFDLAKGQSFGPIQCFVLRRTS